MEEPKGIGPKALAIIVPILSNGLWALFIIANRIEMAPPGYQPPNRGVIDAILFLCGWFGAYMPTLLISIFPILKGGKRYALAGLVISIGSWLLIGLVGIYLFFSGVIVHV